MAVQDHALADGRHMPERLGGHRQPVADAAAVDDDVIGAAHGHGSGHHRDHGRAPAPVRASAPLERRAVALADRDRQRVGCVVGRGWLGQPEQPGDHAPDLILAGAPVAAHRPLDLLGGVRARRDAALAGGQQHDAACLADGERRPGVRAEVQLLDRHRVRTVAVDSFTTWPWISARRRSSRTPAGVSITPAASMAASVRSPRPRRSRCWRCRVDSNDDHAITILRWSRTPPQRSRGAMPPDPRGGVRAAGVCSAMISAPARRTRCRSPPRASDRPRSTRPRRGASRRTNSGSTRRIASDPGARHSWRCVRPRCARPISAPRSGSPSSARSPGTSSRPRPERSAESV